MKCSFCGEKSRYSCDFIRHDGTKVDIQGCERHATLALMRQKDVANDDYWRQRMESFNSQKDVISFSDGNRT